LKPLILIGGFKMIDVSKRTGRVHPPKALKINVLRSSAVKTAATKDFKIISKR
jgi:hypothetical protein